MEQRKEKGTPLRYDDTFNVCAVRLVTEQGRQPTEVAKELGICIDALRSWLKTSGIQMRLAGISSVRHRAYKAPTNSNHSAPVALNPLMRNFSFERPNQAWAAELSGIASKCAGGRSSSERNHTGTGTL